MPRVAVYEDFEHLPVSCAALFHGGVFRSMSWFRVLSTTLGPSALRIYVVESDAGEAQAALPMVGQAADSRWFHVRRLAAVANCYTPLFSPLLADQASAAACLGALAREIAADPTHWDMVILHPMDRDAPVYGATVAALRAVRMAVQPYLCFGNWYLPVSGRCYDDYAGTLAPRLRNTIKRKGNQLAGRLRIEVICCGGGLENALAAYESVYRASWKSPEGNAQFMPQLIRLCAREGWLRLGVAWIDGEPAASQIWLVANGVASIFKLAYDPRFVRHSAGSLLTAALMRHVIDIDRVQEVDFLCGDDAYKQDWMPNRRERWGIAAFNLSTLRGLALAGLHFGRSALKKVLRTGGHRFDHQFE
jgi:hypothetical protein